MSVATISRFKVHFATQGTMQCVGVADSACVPSARYTVLPAGQELVYDLGLDPGEQWPLALGSEERDAAVRTGPCHLPRNVLTQTQTHTHTAHICAAHRHTHSDISYHITVPRAQHTRTHTHTHTHTAMGPDVRALAGCAGKGLLRCQGSARGGVAVVRWRAAASLGRRRRVGGATGPPACLICMWKSTSELSTCKASLSFVDKPLRETFGAGGTRRSSHARTRVAPHGRVAARPAALAGMTPCEGNEPQDCPASLNCTRG